MTNERPGMFESVKRIPLGIVIAVILGTLAWLGVFWALT